MPAARTSKAEAPKRSTSGVRVVRRRARADSSKPKIHRTWVDMSPDPYHKKGLGAIDRSIENPDLSKALCFSIVQGVTMRIFPDTFHRHYLLDFVHADGTRVEGPTDYGLYNLETPGGPGLMPRMMFRQGGTQHIYDITPRCTYQVRRTNGTVLRTITFPPNVLVE